jgi:hypothetical protein
MYCLAYFLRLFMSFIDFEPFYNLIHYRKLIIIQFMLVVKMQINLSKHIHLNIHKFWNLLGVIKPTDCPVNLMSSKSGPEAGELSAWLCIYTFWLGEGAGVMSKTDSTFTLLSLSHSSGSKAHFTLNLQDFLREHLESPRMMYFM